MKNSKRLLFLLVVGFMLHLQLTAQNAKQKTAVDSRPNIILILADDIGFETLSAYGSVSYKTPRLDKLAQKGMRFDQCYAQPLCSPSRLQLMTGKSNLLSSAVAILS